MAANDSMRIFTNLVETLNTNHALFSALKDSLKTEEHLLDEIDKRTIALLVSDFEQSGVHLPDNEVCIGYRFLYEFCCFRELNLLI